MRTAAALAAAMLVAGHGFAQTPLRICVAFHGTIASSGPPALAWLCSTWLPAQSEWPADLKPGSAFVLTIDNGVVRIAGSDVSLPSNTIAVATVELPAGGELVGSCAADGSEDWFVPAAAALPPPWLELLSRLEADVLDRPRTIDAAVLIGHLLGALPEGDPKGDLMQLGASLCGPVTWLAWRGETHLRVRGRSDGGLLLPALLAVSAAAKRPLDLGPLPLRAFVARDGDRAEAARRLVRSDGDATTTTLRALLHGDDELRVAAIDTLVRLRAARELPRIVAAAGPSMPWTTLAAACAVHDLWPDADAAVQQRTRAALARSASPALRRIDPQKLSRMSPTAAADLDSGLAALSRSLLALMLSGIAIYGFWLRERLRLNGTIL